MTFHFLLLALLALPVDSHVTPVKSTSESEEVTKLTVGEMTFEDHSVRFRSDRKSRTCSIDGDAKVTFGDITIAAEKIQMNGNDEDHFRLTCSGNCTWRQDDDSGEVFSGDKLEFDANGVQISGRASLRYGSGDQMTMATCDSIILSADGGYQLSGTVRLQHGESRTTAR